MTEMEGPGGSFGSRSLITSISSTFPKETNRYSLTNRAVLFHTSDQVALPTKSIKIFTAFILRSPPYVSPFVNKDKIKYKVQRKNNSGNSKYTF